MFFVLYGLQQHELHIEWGKKLRRKLDTRASFEFHCTFNEGGESSVGITNEHMYVAGSEGGRDDRCSNDSKLDWAHHLLAM